MSRRRGAASRVARWAISLSRSTSGGGGWSSPQSPSPRGGGRGRAGRGGAGPRPSPETRHYQERLKERVVAQASRLEEMFFAGVQALAEALELKDPYTRGHSVRVSQ